MSPSLLRQREAQSRCIEKRKNDGVRGGTLEAEVSDAAGIDRMTIAGFTPMTDFQTERGLRKTRARTAMI
jgi:hypothetical protein